MNESVKVIIIYVLSVAGATFIALLFLLGLYRIAHGFFREICKRIKKHEP